MKSLSTVFGITLLLVTAGQAQGADWDGGGGGNDNWSTAQNWNPNFAPGTGTSINLDGANDGGNDLVDYDSSATAGPYTGTFTITGMTFSASKAGGFGSTGAATWSGPWTMGGTLPISLGATSVTSTITLTQNNTTTDLDVTSLTIDANTPGAARSLTQAGSGFLDVNGAITLTGDNSAGVDATLTVNASAGLFPDSLDLNGDPTAANGDAILVFNEDVTVQSSTGVVVTGYAQFQIGSGKTFDAFNLTVGDAALKSNLDLVTGSGATVADSLLLKGGNASGEDCIIKATAGSFTSI
jgi:hypothetical protein